MVSYGAALATAWWLRSPAPLLPFLTIPLAISVVRELVTREGPLLNATLGKTAQLLLAFGMLYALGIAVT